MRVWKQPAERRVYNYDFSPQLAGQTIASVLLVESIARAGSSTLTEVLVARVVTPTQVQIAWSGGVDATTYRTTVRVRDTANQEHELDGEIFVSDVQFVLPVGIASTYLTGEEYVERFGYEETVRVTDEGRQGVIDGGALMAAIADAQEMAEAYLATRYPLPISSPPALLRGVVADLARERLHKTRATTAVTDAADRARSMLKDLSAGRMVLVLETGEEASTSGGSGGTASWGRNFDASVFNADKLARF